MIAAFWSNDGMNDDKGTRKQAIEELEENYRQAVRQIMEPDDDPTEEEIDENSPFFSAMKKGMAHLDGLPQSDNETVQRMIEEEKEFSKYIDQ